MARPAAQVLHQQQQLQLQQQIAEQQLTPLEAAAAAASGAVKEQAKASGQIAGPYIVVGVSCARARRVAGVRMISGKRLLPDYETAAETDWRWKRFICSFVLITQSLT